MVCVLSGIGNYLRRDVSFVFIFGRRVKLMFRFRFRSFLVFLLFRWVFEGIVIVLGNDVYFFYCFVNVVSIGVCVGFRGNF